MSLCAGYGTGVYYLRQDGMLMYVVYVGYILHLIANLSVACKRYRGILLSFVSEASRLLYANAEVVSSFNDSTDI